MNTRDQGLGLVIIFLACLLPGTTFAQKPNAAAANVKTRHLLVEVKLRHGSVFQGVALEGRLVERRRRAQFEELGDDDKGHFAAGIRIWYYQDLAGFLFVKYRRIQEVKIVKRLSLGELQRIEERVAASRSDEARGDDIPGKSAPSAQSMIAGMEALSEEQRKLIRTFPPSEGWNPELYEKIQRDSILSGTAPTEKQSDWTTVYPEWLKAFRAVQEVAEGPKPAQSSAPAGVLTSAKKKSPGAKTPTSKPSPESGATKPEAPVKLGAGGKLQKSSIESKIPKKGLEGKTPPPSKGR